MALTSNHAPMLGRLSPLWDDQFAGPARPAERRFVESEVAAWLDSLDDSMTTPELEALLWDEEAAWLLAHADDAEPAEPECYCRRCYLHDDPGGCLRLDRLDAADFAAARALPEDPAWELPGAPGWGEARVDYAEFSDGFHVIDVFARRTGARPAMSAHAREHLAALGA